MPLDAPCRYFWQRLPDWLNLTLLGSTCAVRVLTVLVGGLSLWAQRTADESSNMAHYSVSMHTVAMAAVAGLTVAVAVSLLWLGQPP